MIVVTSATGKLGSAVVENLILHIPASQVAVSVRNPLAARSFAARGVAYLPMVMRILRAVSCRLIMFRTTQLPRPRWSWHHCKPT